MEGELMNAQSGASGQDLRKARIWSCKRFRDGGDLKQDDCRSRSCGDHGRVGQGGNIVRRRTVARFGASFPGGAHPLARGWRKSDKNERYQVHGSEARLSHAPSWIGALKC
jgi:hypothetical protein